MVLRPSNITSSDPTICLIGYTFLMPPKYMAVKPTHLRSLNRKKADTVVLHYAHLAKDLPL